MDVEVLEATDEDRAVVRRLLQLHHHDFSEFDGADVESEQAGEIVQSFTTGQ